MHVLLNDIELYNGELPQGCGNQIFDYCHVIHLAQRQIAHTGDSSRGETRASGISHGSGISSRDVSNTPYSADSGWSLSFFCIVITVFDYCAALLLSCVFNIYNLCDVSVIVVAHVVLGAVVE